MDMQEFWSKMHSEKNNYFLSDTNPAYIWDTLQVSQYFKPFIKVLNIGVGTGRCTKDLINRGLLVHTLDITKEASKAAEGALKQYFSPKDLPENFFDLIISNQVTQHLTDAVLNEQLHYCIKSLTDSGTFAMQFTSGNKLQNNRKESIELLMAGKRTRSPAIISDFIHNNGGCCTHMCGIFQYPECRHDRVHFVKKGS